MKVKYPDFEKMETRTVAEFCYHNSRLKKLGCKEYIDRYEEAIELRPDCNKVSQGEHVFISLVEKLKWAIEANPAKKVVFSVKD